MSGGGLFPTWRSITKNTLDFFGRWGDGRTNLRSMMDSVIPVAVVDRFRDDDEGSVFGTSAFASGGPAGEFPSVSFGSDVNDWELLQIIGWEMTFSTSIVRVMQAQVFTPFNYNPALTVAPVGTFAPGLINNRAFTFGSVRGVGGYNPAIPPLIGPSYLGPFISTGGVARTNIVPFSNTGHLGLPIRVYRNVTLTFQWVGTVGGAELVDTDVAILYRERPKVSQ